jgi:hypothetical protein
MRSARRPPSARTDVIRWPYDGLVPATKAVWQKLFIKPGCVLMWNPPKGYTKWLKGSKAVALAIDMVRLQAYDDQGVENAWIFAKTVDDLGFPLEESSEYLRPETNVIVSYKKGDKAFHRDTLNAEMKKHGFEGVSLIAVDDTWSAMRFKRT